MIIRRNKYDWKTRLKFVQENSTSDKEKVFGNLLSIIDIEMLKDIFKALKPNKATGIDKMSKSEYGENLENNLQELLKNIHTLKYLAKPTRIVEIPKEDGGVRCIAIGCIEDKIIQTAVSKVLTSVYDPIFSKSSFGFRPDISQHDALRQLTKISYKITDGTVIEIDIQKCFDTISHKQMQEFLIRKISDRKLIRLIMRIMKTPKMINGIAELTTIGCPQGNALSPILANIFLHYVIDEWIDDIKTRKYLHKDTELIRYCDDIIILSPNKVEAEKLYQAIPKRLEKFGLQRNDAKSQIIAWGRIAAERAQIMGEKMKTFSFLGFTGYLGLGRNGKFRLKLTTRRDRFTAKLKEIKVFLRKNLNVSNSNLFLKEKLIPIVRGWINYFGISDNAQRVNSFIWNCRKYILKWFNRKGSTRTMIWEKLIPVLTKIGFPSTFKTVSMFYY